MLSPGDCQNYDWLSSAGGHVRGTITVDGHPKDQATFNRVSGYVEQVRYKTAISNLPSLQCKSSWRIVPVICN